MQRLRRNGARTWLWGVGLLLLPSLAVLVPQAPSSASTASSGWTAYVAVPSAKSVVPIATSSNTAGDPIAVTSGAQ